MPTVSESVIGSKKMLSSAQTARMKLVKNDTGTRREWCVDSELSLVMNGFELFSPNVLLAFHHCGVSLPSPQMHCDRERRSKGYECEQISSGVVFTPRGLRRVLVRNRTRDQAARRTVHHRPRDAFGGVSRDSNAEASADRGTA